MRTLVVDGQLFQTGAWDRGMGKITVDFLRALLRRSSFTADWQIVVVLNSRLLEDGQQERISAVFPVKLEFVQADLILPGEGKNYHEAQEANRQAITQAVSDVQNGVYFIPALFEHAIYPVFPDGMPRILLFHDLIPMLFADFYLRNEELREYYYQRFGELLAADVMLANSDTTRNDLLRFLSVDPARVVSIYGAGFDRSDLKPERPKDMPDKPFVLLPAGDDFRKNNELCVRAFELFNAQVDKKYQLVLTSGFSDGTKAVLKNLSSDITFAGKVSDAEFRWLFQNANIVFWGSRYEGLGMPILEAMAEGAGKIVCSDIEVFREIGQDDHLYFCNPLSPDDMSAQLMAAEQSQPTKTYAALEVFTWERSGKLFEEVLRSLPEEHVQPKKRGKIAIVGPDPRGYSSIGKFIQELHPAVAREYECDYFFENSVLTSGEFRTSYLPYISRCRDVSELRDSTYSQYDAVWYHIGNSDYHIATMQRALTYPGYVVLHDTRLRGLFDQLVQRGHISEDRYRTEESFEPLRESEFVTSLANSTKGMLVHSQDAYDKVAFQQLEESDTNLRLLYHPMRVAKPYRTGGKVRIGFGGFTTPRGDDISMKVLQTMLHDQRFANCEFVLFGSGFNYGAGNQLVDELHGNARVVISAELSELDFQDTIAGVDIVFNYRLNYHGETSRFTLEAMRYGACVLVRNVGWYSELPDTSVCKLGAESEIVDATAGLVTDNKKRKAMSRAAIQYVEKLDHEQYVRTMADMQSQNGLRAYEKQYLAAWSQALRAGGVNEEIA